MFVLSVALLLSTGGRGAKAQWAFARVCVCSIIKLRRESAKWQPRLATSGALSMQGDEPHTPLMLTTTTTSGFCACPQMANSNEPPPQLRRPHERSASPNNTNSTIIRIKFDVGYFGPLAAARRPCV